MIRRVAIACTLALAVAGPAAAATPEEEARIELTTYATLYGLGLGAFAAYELDLNLRPAAWLTAGLAGGALWGTWEAARARDLAPNQAAFISSTATWTMVDTLLVSGLFSTGQGPEPAIWLAFGTGALAAGTAYWLAPDYTTSRGDLSLINSGGLWMPVITGLVLIPMAEEIVDHPFVYLLTTTSLGLIGGALLAEQYQPSREQVLYLDAGLLIGALGGGMVGVIGGLLTESVEFGAYLMLGGMAAGAAIAVSNAGFDGGRAAPAAPASAALRRREPMPVPLWVGTW